MVVDFEATKESDMEPSVGIRALKNHLSEYIQRARSGERVIITDRGKPVAVLSSLDVLPEAEASWDLVNQGVASWSGGKPRGAHQRPRVAGSPASDAVLDGRR